MMMDLEAARHEVAHATLEISANDRVLEMRLKEVKLLQK